MEGYKKGGEMEGIRKRERETNKPFGPKDLGQNQTIPEGLEVEKKESVNLG